MERKVFKSILFNRQIQPDNFDYWKILYAEVLSRLKVLNDLKCPCTFCFREKVHLNNLIDLMIKDGHIPENPKPANFNGTGDCGRRLGPAA